MARLFIQSFQSTQRICPSQHTCLVQQSILCMVCAVIWLYCVSSTALAQDDVADIDAAEPPVDVSDHTQYPQTHTALIERAMTNSNSVRTPSPGEIIFVRMRPYDFALLCRDLGLNDQQRMLATVFFEEYTATLRKIDHEVNERAPRHQLPEGVDQQTMTPEENAAMWAEITAANQRRTSLIRAAFPVFDEALDTCLDSIHALLDDDQLKRWPAARMTLRRVMWLNPSTYRDTGQGTNNLGVTVDLNWLFHDEAQPNGLLHQLLGKIEPPDEHWRAAREQAQLIITEYNEAMDDLLSRNAWGRIATGLQTRLEFHRTLARVPEERTWDQYMAVREPLAQHRVRLLNLNDRTMQRIAQVLRTVHDPEHAERWIDACYAMQYPDLYGMQDVYPLARDYRAAMAREDLSVRDRQRIEELYAEYERLRRPLLREAAESWRGLWRETNLVVDGWGDHPHLHDFLDALKRLELVRGVHEPRIQRLLLDATW